MSMQYWKLIVLHDLWNTCLAEKNKEQEYIISLRRLLLVLNIVHVIFWMNNKIFF